MHRRASSLTMVLLLVAGCAGGEQQFGNAGTASPQQKAASQSTDYRTQANVLREMADRRQLEGDLLERELGSNGLSVEKKRHLAEELRAAASDAENKARSLSRNVP